MDNEPLLLPVKTGRKGGIMATMTAGAEICNSARLEILGWAEVQAIAARALDAMQRDEKLLGEESRKLACQLLAGSCA